MLNVSSKYTTADGTQVALQDVTTDIAEGTKVGLVGRTGSGKSSLILTLLNCLSYTGAIVIDGIEISDISSQILRSRITTIAQDLLNLPCSIRDNVVQWDVNKLPGQRVEDAVIIAAVQRVGLHKHILANGGLDASMEDVGLSNGQKQLLALARAIVHNGQTKGKLLLVDEATSGVDVECEAKMHQVMTEVFEDYIVLTNAHRRQTMIAFDMLLEMSEGRLVCAAVMTRTMASATIGLDVGCAYKWVITQLLFLY